MMAKTMLLGFSLILLECGTSSGGTDAGSDTCLGYRASDACMTQENFLQCQEMATRCPGEVQILESCPLQFACP